MRLRAALTPLLLLLPWSAGQAQEPDAPAEEVVLVRRLSDVVVVREGPKSQEHVLYYFNPTARLVPGGHLEQGSGGHSELALSGGGLLSMHAGGHVELLRLSPDGDVIRLSVVTRLEVRAGDRPLELVLPGGTTCRLVPTDLMFVQLEPGRLRIRNQGSEAIAVTGDLRLSRDPAGGQAEGRLELQAGEEVLMPLFGVGGSDEGTVTELWGWLVVRHGRTAAITMEGDRLRVARDAASSEPNEAFTVRGVYTLAAGADRLVIHDPLHAERPAEPAPPPVTAPPAVDAPPAPEATTETPPETPTDTPADPGDEEPRAGEQASQEPRS